MIISVRSLSYDELKRNLNHDDKIVIWSCDTCVKHCGIAGMEKMIVLEDMLKEDGYTVLKKELVSESCQVNLAKKHKAANEDIFNEATAIILLTCEIGYQCVTTVFPRIEGNSNCENVRVRKLQQQKRANPNFASTNYRFSAGPRRLHSQQASGRLQSVSQVLRC